MEHSLAWLALISIIVAIDNALLAGIILPYTANKNRKTVISFVGLILCVSQIGLSIGVERLMGILFFQILAFSVLSWMSIRTVMNISPIKRAWRSGSLILKVSFYTVVGNLDNMIWLGTELKYQHFWLMFFSIVTIPLFIIIALFLSNQSEQHQWILLIGAGMMAWAASALVTNMPVRQFHDITNHGIILQISICLMILIAGFSIRKFNPR